jgi:hypothetical protein
MGWAIEGLRVGASIFSIGTLIGALTLIAGKGFSGQCAVLQARIEPQTLHASSGCLTG